MTLATATCVAAFIRPACAGFWAPTTAPTI
jgi:hypothetical protein